MAIQAYPSYAYNSAGQPAIIVLNAGQFAALAGPGTWAFTPYPPPTVPTTPPYDPGFQDTDIRLQQLLVESRVQSLMMAQAFNINDDPVTVLRPDVLANDSGLTT